MNIAIYLRVSTPKKVTVEDIKKKSTVENPFLQNPEVQLEPLMKLIDFKGWKVYKIFSDRMSGAKGEDKRPAFREMMNAARKGLIDGVLVWRFDRFARSSIELLKALQEFQELKIQFISYTENVDTSTAIGKAMFTLIAAFAEMERENTIERINAGIEYAKEHGTKSGKEIGRPKKVFRRDLAIEMRQAGKSIRQIARELGVSPAIAHRELQGVSKPVLRVYPFPADSSVSDGLQTAF